MVEAPQLEGVEEQVYRNVAYTYRLQLQKQLTLRKWLVSAISAVCTAGFLILLGIVLLSRS